MHNSVSNVATGMAALIGLNAEMVEKIIIANSVNLQIANDNSNIQVVISGSEDELNKSKFHYSVTNSSI